MGIAPAWSRSHTDNLLQRVSTSKEPSTYIIMWKAWKFYGLGKRFVVNE
ncbi:hypothetical protein Desaci_1100 [Desulfosporosinus acidiphilus SJ4]|uniref:Uncharacterized protein n=1 Tax=Desulfosporosinus acidiphilus (strain DSM 22704 / JCM 16185 / SJ4) TaxID=646529 RepID=I4D2W5_DESAJ|nr:hypothetical protein Desaci_1100 [Desulfosporosinus acidiphilus SJ4]